jgi:polyhydroxyalkanoate synthase
VKTATPSFRPSSTPRRRPELTKSSSQRRIRPIAFHALASHLASAPQRQMEISRTAVRNAKQFLETALHWFSSNQGPWSLIKPQPQDRRFAGPEWESPPFNLLARRF